MENGQNVKVLSDDGSWYDAEVVEVLPEDHDFYPNYVCLKVKVPRAISWSEQCSNVKPYIIQEWISKKEQIK